MPDLAYRVDAAWDEVASVWIATSNDVPGLCAEAATLESLIDIVLGLEPELGCLQRANQSDKNRMRSM